MTKDQVKAGLMDRGVDAELIARIIEIVEQCEIARFSPGMAAFKQPGELLEKAKEVLNRL